MGRGVNSPSQSRGHRDTTGSQIFGESLRAIDAVTGGSPGPHNSHLGEVGKPRFTPYIEDGGRVEYLPQKTGVFGVEDVQNANSEAFRFLPLRIGTIERS